MRGRLAILFCLAAVPALPLDPQKSLTQYSRTTWTQMQGLPQDTIRAIAQTADGYLWLGTDEGLARFDGYEFTTFQKANGNLPSNSVTALAAAADGGLWIGTTNGLVLYRNKRFRTYTPKDGLADESISQLYVDRHDVLWVVAGIHLCRFEDGKFVTEGPGPSLPLTTARAVREDRNGVLWVAGLSAVGTWKDKRFVPLVDAKTLNGSFITPMIDDRAGNLWFGGNRGLFRRGSDGKVRTFSERDGLPDAFVRALWEDRDGNIWAGTNAGVARSSGEKFIAAPEGGPDSDMVRCLFEDREGNLWVGSNSGLTRYRDTAFTVYGKSEGLPSDEPNAVFQDRSGRIWAGFHDAGLALLEPGAPRVFTTSNGLPNNEIFSLRASPGGDLLIGARAGFVRLRDGRFTTFVPPDPLARLTVFDALEDAAGIVWLATPGGLGRLEGKSFRTVVPGAPVLASAIITLGASADGAIWAGSYGKGLWRVKGEDVRHFTAADGLPSEQIRSLYQDRDGTLWIGTFGGGLAARKGDRFTTFNERDGLLSDNIAHISDDGESLWLSTTRGVCRIAKAQLGDFAAGRRKSLSPTNYSLEDGLRSAQCSPSYPAGGGGSRTFDGRLWFTTTRGIAVFDPKAHQQPPLAPAVQFVDITSDGDPLDPAVAARLKPGAGRVQFRYTALHLSAPERVQYSYRLHGLDPDWVQAGGRRVINYNSLPHGHYRFVVRAELPGGLRAEQSYAFEVLPYVYERTWFRLLAVALVIAAGWGMYQFRLRRIRSRFSAVLDERARLAREIHDTLAQGFVGISSQLDAVAMCMPEDEDPARKHLDLARKMARHSLTEARRSVMDLRASVLEGQDLSAALQSSARQWTAGSGVEVEVDVSGTGAELPQDYEQHLLRIAQEAVANTLKHSGATRILIRLHLEARKLYLRIKDNGRGFDQEGAFASVGGHFGLLGMRERAERLGGELRLASHPGEGTEVEVSVPLP
jgi:signal transduction histidine kinase/ligand-binding sensor domain-containing protein